MIWQKRKSKVDVVDYDKRKPVSLNALDDSRTRARKALTYAGFVNFRHGLDDQVGYILSEYAKLDEYAHNSKSEGA